MRSCAFYCVFSRIPKFLRCLCVFLRVPRSAAQLVIKKKLKLQLMEREGARNNAKGPPGNRPRPSNPQGGPNKPPVFKRNGNAGAYPAKRPANRPRPPSSSSSSSISPNRPPHGPRPHKNAPQRPQLQGAWSAKQSTPNASSTTSTSTTTTTSARLETVAKLQQKTSSILQQYREQNLLDSDSDQSSGDEENKIDDAIFRHYNQIAGETGMGERTKNIIHETQKGGSRCLVCLEKVKAQDATWQCDQCYCLLHMSCIQKWIKEGTSYNAIEDIKKVNWFCPKCRKEHLPTEVPTRYKCFCEKVEDPPFDPWATPHSCGQLCDKPLKPPCGHKCTLLCHPGPCPPCPQTVKAACYCGSTTQMVRCANKNYSCGKVCKAILPCGLHKCEDQCHAGPCPPCKKESVRSCRCGRVSEVKPCCESDFSCETVCGKSFSCGKHTCEKVCHAGSCGACPLSGPRSCPCGKVVFTLPCDQQTPSCGGTCEKTLLCERHPCLQRCHNGPCPVCRSVVLKHCRCGQSKKEMMCCTEYLCEKRCTKMRNCRRHQCKKKCCPGNCPPCTEECDRKLNCGNHKCESVCHTGPCYPCPKTVDVNCACGMTKTTVPCGREGQTKPPKCKYRCTIPPTCHHSERQPHACHFGPCPPCSITCDAPLPECPHPCPLPCHDPIPPPPPVKKGDRNKNKLPKPLPKLPLEKVVCPPCEVMVPRWCRGEHEVQEIKCSGKKEFSCVNACGNPLECGNHLCSRVCHIITRRRKQIKDEKGKVLEVVDDLGEDVYDGEVEDANFEDSEEGMNNAEEGGEEQEGGEVEEGMEEEYWEEDTCDPCPLRCQRPRDPPCPHPCPLACHLGPCPICVKPVKQKCHCGSTTLSIECNTFTTTDNKDSLICCGQKCRKNLPDCTHDCKLICHTGACPATCTKQVVTKCSCGRQKAEMSCTKAQELRKKQSVQKKDNLTLLTCDEQCEEKKEETLRLRKRQEKEEEEAKALAREAKAANVKYDTRGQKIVEKSRKKEILDARRTFGQKIAMFFKRHQKLFLTPLIIIGACLFVWLYLQANNMRIKVPVQ